MVFTYWYTQWATKAVQNSPRIILLYWFVGLVGWWCETRWIPIYLMMVNTLKWYPYNRTPCVQDVMVIFQLNYYCSIFFLRNFYQVTSYKMHGWFGSSREKKRGEEWFLFIIIYQYWDEMVFNKMVSCPPSSTFLPLFRFTQLYIDYFYSSKSYRINTRGFHQCCRGSLHRQQSHV